MPYYPKAEYTFIEFKRSHIPSKKYDAILKSKSTKQFHSAPQATLNTKIAPSAYIRLLIIRTRNAAQTIALAMHPILIKLTVLVGLRSNIFGNDHLLP